MHSLGRDFQNPLAAQGGSADRVFRLPRDGNSSMPVREFPKSGDLDRLAYWYGVRHGYLEATLDPGPAFRQIQKEAARTLAEGPGVLQIRVLLRLARVLAVTNRQKTDSLVETVVRTAESLADREIQQTAIHGRHLWALGQPGDGEHRLAAATEMIQLASHLDDDRLEFHGRHLRIAIDLSLGNLAAAGTELDFCERLAERLRNEPVYAWTSEALRALLALLEDPPRRGRFIAEDVLRRTAGDVDVAGSVTRYPWVPGLNAAIGLLYASAA